MKIDVTEYEKKYTFELKPITQLCGQNIPKKSYILESIRRYFSAYKYSEERNKWRNNVKIDDELVGRKFFYGFISKRGSRSVDVDKMVEAKFDGGICQGTHAGI